MSLPPATGRQNSTLQPSAQSNGSRANTPPPQTSKYFCQQLKRSSTPPPHEGTSYFPANSNFSERSDDSNKSASTPTTPTTAPPPRKASRLETLQATVEDIKATLNSAILSLKMSVNRLEAAGGNISDDNKTKLGDRLARFYTANKDDIFNYADSDHIKTILHAAVLCGKENIISEITAQLLSHDVEISEVISTLKGCKASCSLIYKTLHKLKYKELNNNLNGSEISLYMKTADFSNDEIIGAIVNNSKNTLLLVGGDFNERIAKFSEAFHQNPEFKVLNDAPRNFSRGGGQNIGGYYLFHNKIIDPSK